MHCLLCQESTQRNSALGLPKHDHVEVLTARALVCIHCGSTHHIDPGVEGTPNSKPPHLSVFARALPLSRSLQLSFILRILLVQAHTFNVVERTGSTPPILVCESHDVHSKASSFPISWFSHVYLAIVTGGFCTCLAIVPVSAAVFHLRMLHCTGQAGRAKPTIKDRPKDQSDQSVYRTDPLEIWDRPAERSERSWTLPVGSKASFPFRWSASEVRAKRPIDAHTRGHPCSTDAKSFATPQLVWTGWRN